MRDRSSAQVALAGSGLGILPAISGGLATCRGRRVMTDPAPRLSMRRGLTVRAPRGGA